MKYKLHFIHQDIISEVEGGTIADACAKVQIPLSMPCGGQGTCGKCKVSIRGKRDKAGSIREVLACRTLVEEDLDIFVSSAEISGPQPTDYDKEANDIFFEPASEPGTSSGSGPVLASGSKTHPSVIKVYHPANESLGEGASLLKAAATPDVMRRYSLHRKQSGYTGSTFVYFNEELIDIQDGDTRDQLYGAAIDIGTTTVALYIYDLNTGDQLVAQSAWNSQAMHGADVISRINYASQSEEHLQAMQRDILETISGLIRQSGLSEQQLENLYHITVCGNSTMQHLFLALDPSALGTAPFLSICKQSVCVSACELFDSAIGYTPMASRGVIEFLPLLGGFVGADTAAVLLTLPETVKEDSNKEANMGKRQFSQKVSQEDINDLYLMVDLGTNGEIALGNHSDGFLVASTACGPALEGGNISCGMRAESGAIDRIRLVEGELELHWIGADHMVKGQAYQPPLCNHIEPKGLCGSGLVDAVAILLKLGIIDGQGYLRTPEEYLEQLKQPSSDYKALQEYRKKRKLAKQIRETEPGHPDSLAFFFTSGEEPVYLSQKDIRQFQLAKSAIYAGCMTLLEEAGIIPEGLSPDRSAPALTGLRLFLAGAFGNYINIDHALSLGMLPRVPRSKVTSVGNGAGRGVCSLLLDAGLRGKMHSITQHVRHIELANNPEFMKHYIQDMDLG